MRQALEVRNPRTGMVDATICCATPSDVTAATARLRQSYPAWAGLELAARSARLRRLAAALEEARAPLLAALQVDTGRGRIAEMELDGVIASIDSWIQRAPDLLPHGWTKGRANPAIRHTTQFVPYPVVGVISPWNFPLTLSMIDAIPALLAGCTVLLKPSETTPRFAEPLQDAIRSAGLGDVFEIVTGAAETGSALVAQVDAVCFTGSVSTGRRVAVDCASRLIPAFLELGGKDPLIVLADADIELATDAALRGSVLATGQACQSIERIYVDHQIHDRFLTRLCQKAEAVRLTWPDPEFGEIGPIIFAKQADTLASHIADARRKGARVLTGGEIEHHGGGRWMRPTVLADVTHDMLVMREETFGPIMPVMGFSTQAEAIQLANDTSFGLSAAVFSGDMDRATAVAKLLDVGAISLNDTSLTGVFHEAEKQSFKSSGLGASRMGASGFLRFFRRKAIIAQTAHPAPLAAFSESGAPAPENS